MSRFAAECLLIVSCHVTASPLCCSLAGLMGCGFENALLAFDAAVLARLPLLCIAGGPGQACKYLEMLELLASPRESGGSRRIIFYDQACSLASALLLIQFRLRPHRLEALSCWWSLCMHFCAINKSGGIRYIATAILMYALCFTESRAPSALRCC